jgi:hypothetical protein
MGFICRVSLSPDSCVRKTEDFFDRWGLRSLVFSKFVPGFSLIAPPLAGALPAFRFRQFIVFDLAGSIVWAASALAAGVVFHTAIGSILDRLAALGNWALFILGALLLLFLAFKWYDRRRFYRRLRLARIPVEELRERIENGTPIVILDVRSTTAQTRDPRRIPGALLVQPEQLEERLRDIAPDEEIALYCT